MKAGTFLDSQSQSDLIESNATTSHESESHTEQSEVSTQESSDQVSQADKNFCELNFFTKPHNCTDESTYITYFHKGTFEHFIFTTCRQAGIKNIRLAFNCVSIITIFLIGALFLTILDSMRNQVILPMTKEILQRENIPDGRS